MVTVKVVFIAAAGRHCGPHQHGDQVARATGDGVAAQSGKAAVGVCVVHGGNARPGMGLRA